MTLDERVAWLAGQVDAAPTAGDAAQLAGVLGLALLELYQRDGDEGALTAAVLRLRDAVAGASEPASRSEWLFWLGVAHAAKGDRGGTVDDYDSAIECLSEVYCGRSDDIDPDEVALALADAHWDRYLLRAAENDATDYQLATVADLVTALESMIDRNDGGRPYPLLMSGLSRLRRYEIGAMVADLDRGIELLATALQAPDSGLPRLGFAAACLADAYRKRAELNEDIASADLSFAVAARAIAWSADDPTVLRMLYENQAIVLGVRWRMFGERAELDGALSYWGQVEQASPDEPLDPWQAAQFGYLLCERAERDNDPDSAAAAVTQLRQATEAAPDGFEAWQRWYWLGRALRLRAALTSEPELLARAMESLRRAVAFGIPDHDDVVGAHFELVAAGVLAVLAEREQRPGEPAPSATRFAGILREANAALAGADAAAPQLRSAFAYVLAWADLRVADPDGAVLDPTTLTGLLDLAARLPDPPEGWPGMLDLCRGLLGVRRSTAPGIEGDGGIADLTRVLAADGVDDEAKDGIRQSLPLMAVLRAQRSGDLRLREAAEALLRAAAAGPPGTAQPEASALAAVMAALNAGSGGDVDVFVRAWLTAEHVFAALPPGLDSAGSLGSMVRSMRQLARAARAEPIDDTDPALPDRPTNGFPDEAALSPHLVTAAARLSSAYARNDLVGLRSGAARLEQLATLVAPGGLLRLGTCGTLGQAWLWLAQRDPQDRDAAQRSARWFGEAMRLAGGPQHALWPRTALGRAQASRLASPAGHAESRALGLSALVSHAMHVLLQAGTSFALDAARAATADAFTVAGWCLADEAYDELAMALDASRGLTLQAAVTSRDVADRLADLGHPDLAAQWRATHGLGRDHVSGLVLTDAAVAGEMPDDLRVRVLTALTDGSAGLDAVHPMPLDQLRESVVRHGSDALVYLVPGATGHFGFAVIVPAHGVVDVAILPRLTVDPNAPVGPGAEPPAEGTRDVAAAGQICAPGVDDLCQWAWQAAVGELVERTRRWRLDRPARLVLVPMHRLATVPWHAAYTMDGHARRYAVDDLVFSYIPTGRMLAEAARHPIRPIRASLVVGNPTGDLTFAGIEARAVHTTYYPDGTYLGRPLDQARGAGTPAEVLAWIGSAGMRPSLLHFACHGFADPSRPAGAYLRLAGDILGAAELIDAARSAELSIERVFLAACATNSAGEQYDEAFSLATAFLASGAHTVFGSLWPVPDLHTSLMMFMLHHFLNREALAPMDALHAAQLWMLDPHRQPPAEMPDELARYAGEGQCRDPLAWAAFTHLGR